eukprot:11213806-Lingulodinium_polyedra.AAC.1
MDGALPMAIGPSPICAAGGAVGGKATAAAPGAQRPADAAEPACCAPPGPAWRPAPTGSR